MLNISNKLAKQRRHVRRRREPQPIMLYQKRQVVCTTLVEAQESFPNLNQEITNETKRL